MANALSSLFLIGSLLQSTLLANSVTQPAQAASTNTVISQHPATARQLLTVVDQDDIEQRHKRIAHDVLRAMPRNCRSTLKNFYVRYDNPKQRGLAGKTTMILDGNVPDQEFRALMIHELGHVFDLNGSVQCLGGTRQSGVSEFRDGGDVFYMDDPSLAFYRISWKDEKTQNNDTKPSDFVTGYAMHDVFEDFSESMVYFVLQNDAFAARAQTNAALAAKYRWFQMYLFSSGISVAEGSAPKSGRPPWDATKLGYRWHL